MQNGDEQEKYAAQKRKEPKGSVREPEKLGTGRGRAEEVPLRAAR